MAVARLRTVVHGNPARRRASALGRGRRSMQNRARRKLSPAQIRAGFGGKRRQTAMRTRKNSEPMPRLIKHRAGSMGPRMARKWRAFKKKHPERAAAVERGNPRRRRQNFGEIVSFTTLGALNPAKGRRNRMAVAKRRPRRAAAHSNGARRNRPRKNAPARHMHASAQPHFRRSRAIRRKRPNPVRRHHQRNPSMGGFGGKVVDYAFLIGGAVGSSLLAQAVLGASNTGVMGYGADLVAGGLLAWGAKMLPATRKYAASIFGGSMVAVMLRAIRDYTPFGTYLSQAGLGNWGVGMYMPWNGVSPQRYIDPLNQSQVQIPSGWAPTTVVQSAKAPAGMGAVSIYDGSAQSIY